LSAHPPTIDSKESNASSETGIDETPIKQAGITDLIQVDQSKEDSSKRSEKRAAKKEENNNNENENSNEDSYKYETPEFNRDLLRRIVSRSANLLEPACATPHQHSNCHPERSEGPM
jgi:hypothetical protein